MGIIFKSTFTGHCTRQFTMDREATLVGAVRPGRADTIRRLVSNGARRRNGHVRFEPTRRGQGLDLRELYLRRLHG